jgi:dTDP-4-amino-4,6-dideoxygalactose transaminase
MAVIFDDPAKREKAKKALEGSGLGASLLYGAAITDYEYLKDITGKENDSNARYLSERMLTLSTSTFLKKSDITRVCEMIKKSLHST